MDNYIELAGAFAGILYVFLEIRQNIWLWPVGIITSALYIIVFFTGKLYADMLLQVYYLIISIAGWLWWAGKNTGKDRREIKSKAGSEDEKPEKLTVKHASARLAAILCGLVLILILAVWYLLRTYTDSPVPFWDSFIASVSVIATWMLARKIIEHWYLWIIVNSAASLLFLSRGLYPTMVLYIIYLIMSLAGLREWRKSVRDV